MELLAVIGCFALLYWILKGFGRLGRFLNRIQEDWAVRNVSVTQRAPRPRPVKEKTHALNGEGTDDQYQAQVRQEIEKLTGGD